jgi:hypothetical protein
MGALQSVGQVNAGMVSGSQQRKRSRFAAPGNSGPTDSEPIVVDLRNR